MAMKALLKSTALIAAALIIFSGCAAAQEMDKLKSSVVRIHNPASDETGTGFIVKIDKTLLYIVTASHVVQRQEHPEILLFNRQHLPPLRATVINRETNSNSGLALLTLLAVDKTTFDGLTAIDFATSKQLRGGDDVTVIGFPDGTEMWTVSKGNVSRQEGNILVFSGPIRPGYSGAPVILSNGQVIGLVTDTLDQRSTSYAAVAEIVVSYINGLAQFKLTAVDSDDRPLPAALTNSASGLVITLESMEVFNVGNGNTKWDFTLKWSSSAGMEEQLHYFRPIEYQSNRVLPIQLSWEVRPANPKAVLNSITLSIMGRNFNESEVTAIGTVGFAWPPWRPEPFELVISVQAKTPTVGAFAFNFKIRSTAKP